MSTAAFSEFETSAREQGYDEVLERQWRPLAEVHDHAHPFALRALVVQGEMWLTVGGLTRHLRVGDAFELDAHAQHEERYGPQGATYWVARRNAPAGDRR